MTSREPVIADYPSVAASSSLVSDVPLRTLQTLVLSSPLAIAVVDPEPATVRLWNPAAANLFGWSETEIIGRVLPIVPPEKLSECADYRGLVHGGESFQNQETYRRRKNGSRIEVSISAAPLRDADGTVNGILLVFGDISDRKRAEQALEKSARQKEALYQLVDRLHRTKSLVDVYDAALQAILDALQCDRASILLFDAGGVMRFVGSRGLSQPYQKAVEGHSPWRPDDTSPQPICIHDIDLTDISDALKATVTGEGIHALAFIPLVSNGKLIGKFMTYFNEPHAFGGDEIELSLTIARQLAFGIDRLRTEDALRESERRFREMIDALPAAIYTTDAEGRVTHFNPAAVEFSGRMPQVGQDHWCVAWKLFHPDGTPMPLDACPMAVSLKERRAMRGTEAIVERPDGTRRWLAPYPTPLYDGQGELIGGINMLVDITDRKRAEELLRCHARQLSLITDTAPVFIAYCDTDARFRFVNKAYAARFGLLPEDCVDKHISDIIGEQAYGSIRPHVEAALRGEPTTFEVEVPYATLGKHFMLCAYAPELDSRGKVVGFVGAITDITERKQVEEALRQSEDRLKDADRRKDEFLATLAHELRGPLAPLSHGLHVVKRQNHQPAAVEHCASMMERQLAQMVRLIDDLLDVSRISRGKIELRKERVALAQVMEQAIETSRPLIEANEHRFSVVVPTESLYVHADVARMIQVVGNLLNNACKFTPKGGAISLAVERDGEDAVIRVCDTGIGIDADQFSRIFDMFTQAHAAHENSHGGLGIGLTLVKNLMEMHGGEVAVRSSGAGHGSEFAVRIPLVDMGANASADIATHPDATNIVDARRVLVVDDNCDSAESLATLLDLSGHETHTANDGVAALLAAETFKPDVILLDIGLPKLNGYDVARRIRRTSWGRNTVLVALTGWGQETDRRKSMEAGFNVHLIKPVDQIALMNVLQQSPKLDTRPQMPDASR